MKKLTMKTKPRSLTLSQMWELHLLDGGEETSEFVVKVLDLCYPNKSRDNLDIMDKMKKYFDAKFAYSTFASLVQGLVGNGN